MVRVGGELSGVARASNICLDARRRRAAWQRLFAAAWGTLGRCQDRPTAGLPCAWHASSKLALVSFAVHVKVDAHVVNKASVYRLVVWVE